MASDDDDIIELEAMRNDYSWLPCRVSLSYDGNGLLLEFEGNKSEKMQLGMEEVILQLRVRSVLLKDYDCSLVKPGERVLATLSSNHKSSLFDAVVEEVITGRHSRSTNCRCNFKIKWLQLDQIKEIFTLPSTSVRRLSTKSIHAHQTVHAYLESAGKLPPKSVPPIQNHYSDSAYDLDISMLVERQAEGVGALSSNPNDMMVSGDSTEHTVSSQSATKNAVISDNNVYRGPNNLRMSTKNLAKLNVSQIDHRSAFSQCSDDLINTHCLSPLAACAALALHLSKTPVKFEFAVQSKEKEMVPGDAPRNRSMKRKSASLRQPIFESSPTPRYNTRIQCCKHGRRLENEKVRNA